MMEAVDFQTTRGDEFIVSLAAVNLGLLVKNAGSYIFRFWTGLYHLINTRYEFDPLVVLHMPDQKNVGMIKIFDKYIATGKMLPGNSKIHKMLSLRPILPEPFRVRLFLIDLKRKFRR